MPIDTDRLTAAIKAQGGIARVAEVSGLDTRTVSRARKPGHHEISLDTVERLCRATGLGIAEMVRPGWGCGRERS